MREYTLEEIAADLIRSGCDGTKPVIVDYDADDDWMGEDYARITVWLKRDPEEDND